MRYSDACPIAIRAPTLGDKAGYYAMKNQTVIETLFNE